MAEMAMFNVQRAIISKAGRPEFRFMSPTHPLIVLYVCVKFGENITHGIRAMEQTRMTEALTETDRHSKFWTALTYYTCHFLWRCVKSPNKLFFTQSTTNRNIKMKRDNEYHFFFLHFFTTSLTCASS